MTGKAGKADGRGRPLRFHAAARVAYLAARREGANQKEAAAAVGVAAKTVRDTRRTDPAFRAADDAAAAEGKTRRLDHGESRYNHLGCRCPICKKAATAARAGRRDRADNETGATDGAEVVPIPVADQGSPDPFLLARAS